MRTAAIDMKDLYAKAAMEQCAKDYEYLAQRAYAREVGIGHFRFRLPQHV